MKLPGIGVVIAMTILSAIGDVHRFASADKLVGYSGIGAGVHDSGQEHIEKPHHQKWPQGITLGDDRSCLACCAHVTVLERAV